MSDFIFVLCAGCDGEGREYETAYWWSYETGPDSGEVDVGPCRYCGGTGQEAVPCEPATLEDIEGAPP